MLLRKSFKMLTIVLSIALIGLSFINFASAWVLTSTHWQTNGTYWYDIGSDITDAGVFSITQADNQWNGISNKKVSLANTNTRTTTKSFTQNSRNELFKNNMGNTGYLGLTRIWWYNGINYEADTVYNIYYPFSASTPPTPGTYHLRSTATHEMGHPIGLDESNVWNAVMRPSLDMGEQNYTLTSDDINGYNDINGSSLDRVGKQMFQQ